MKRIQSAVLLMAFLLMLTACDSDYSDIVEDNGEVYTSSVQDDLQKTEDNATEQENSSNTEKEPEKQQTAPTYEFVKKSAENSKTILIYMIGSDLTSAAVMDIVEAMSSGVDTTRNNIVFYTGGAEEWPIDMISSELNMYLHVIRDDVIIESEDDTLLNMGEAETLAEAIQYCCENYPADSYGLILWDHGSGPLIGYGLDQNYGDLLDMAEISQALETAGFGADKKMEFIGFDACLMGSVETAWLLKDYSKYMIFSQETEPGWGWNYEFMDKLDVYDSGADIGREIIDSYFSAGEEYFREYPNLDSDLTLSCVDLSQLDAVETAIDNLFEKLDTQVLNNYHQSIVRSRRETKTFGKFSTDFDYDIIDLMHFSERVSESYPEESKQLITALKNAVTYSKSNVDSANGLSIYFPFENKEYAPYFIYQFMTFDFAEKYTDFILDFYSVMSQEQDSSWKAMDITPVIQQTEDNGYEFNVQLSPDQIQDFAKANYHILKMVPNGMKDSFVSEKDVAQAYYVYNGVDAKLNEDGTITASLPQKLIYVESGLKMSEPIPVLLQQSDDGVEDGRYHIRVALYGDRGGAENMQLIGADLQLKITDNVPHLLMAVEKQDDNTIAQKQLLDYTQFDTIQFLNTLYDETYDEKGNLLPINEWHSILRGQEYSPMYGFELSMKEIDEPELYYCIFDIYDLQGDCYTTEPIALSENGLE